MMLKNIVQSLLSRGSVAGINFLILLISSRYLGVSSRGEISLLLLGISIMQALSGVYTGQSLVHFIPNENLSKLATGAVLFTLAASGICNVVLVMLHKQVPGYEWKAFLVAIIVIFNTFNCMVILGKGDFKMFNVFSVLQPLLLLVGLAYWIFIKQIYTFESYFYPLVISFVVSVTLSSILLLKYIVRGHSGQLFRTGSILTSGFQYQAALILLLFCSRYCYYLLPDNANLGLYASAVTITESVLIIANGLGPLILSQSANAENSELVGKKVLILGKAIFICTLAGLILLCLMPDKAFVFLLGNGFRGIHHLTLAYAPAALLMSLIIPLTAFFNGTGKQGTILLAYLTGSLLAAVSAPALISYAGATGAAFCTCCSFFVITLILLLSFMKSNKMNFIILFAFKGNLKELKNQLFKSK